MQARSHACNQQLDARPGARQVVRGGHHRVAGIPRRDAHCLRAKIAGDRRGLQRRRLRRCRLLDHSPGHDFVGLRDARGFVHQRRVAFDVRVVTLVDAPRGGTRLKLVPYHFERVPQRRGERPDLRHEAGEIHLVWEDAGKLRDGPRQRLRSRFLEQLHPVSQTLNRLLERIDELPEIPVRDRRGRIVGPPRGGAGRCRRDRSDAYRDRDHRRQEQHAPLRLFHPACEHDTLRESANCRMAGHAPTSAESRSRRTRSSAVVVAMK